MYASYITHAAVSLTALPESLAVAKCHSWLSANLPKTNAEMGSVTWHTVFSQSSVPSEGWGFIAWKELKTVNPSLLESVLLSSENKTI